MTKIIAWGSYDLTKPRVRLLLEALRSRGALAESINIPAWNSIRDKAVATRWTLFRAALRILFSYPAALVRLIRQARGSVVVLVYSAIPDIFFAWPIARLGGHRIVFDAFISMHDTIVNDRGLVDARTRRAKLIRAVEQLALRLADIILVDTDQHGDFFASEFGIARERFQTVLVGAEPDFWRARAQASPQSGQSATGDANGLILFYGQLIPLHGVDSILEAIRLTEADPFRWLVVGSGQDEPRLRDFVAAHPNPKVEWRRWVEYDALPGLIRAATVGLGIFGTSDKAGRVIPNKLFQILAAGKPVITRASPAVDSLARRYPETIVTVAPGDGAALAQAVRAVCDGRLALRPFPEEKAGELGAEAGVDSLLARLQASSRGDEVSADGLAS